MELDYRIEKCLAGGHLKNEAERAVRCVCCNRALYEGESCYNFYGDVVCDECEYDYVLKSFRVYL